MQNRFIFYLIAWTGLLLTNNAFAEGSPSPETNDFYSELQSLFRTWWIWAIILSVLAAIRGQRWAKEENTSIFDAYMGKALQNKNMPEFEFITHDTTVQEVIAKLGPPSQRRDLALDSVAGKKLAPEYRVEGISIPVLEYDMPYNAAFMVMPEYPGKPEDKIRAVFYRGAQDLSNSDVGEAITPRDVNIPTPLKDKRWPF